MLSYGLHLSLLTAIMLIVGAVIYSVQSFRHGRVWVSRGVFWTPRNFALAWAVVTVVTVLIGAVVYRR